MEIGGGDINGLRGDTFGVKPNELFMDIIRGDKNRVFLHDLIKITERTVSEGTIFMHIKMASSGFANASSYSKFVKLLQDISMTSQFHRKYFVKILLFNLS